MRKPAPIRGRLCAIVITGTPGTGKTAISKSLSREVGAQYLSLTRFVIGKRLHSAIDVQRRSRVVDFERTRGRLKKLLSRAKSMVVIDTHIPDAIPREYVRMVIVLRCHPRVLQARLRMRHWSVSKIRENVLAEILDSCYTTAVDYYGARRIAQVDTSRVSLAKSVKQSKRILKRQPIYTAKVDWLSVLIRDHSLERYLG